MLTTDQACQTDEAYIVTVVEDKWKEFWSVQLLLLFHINIWTNDEISGESEFVRYFEITTSIDNVDNVLICLCLGMATGDHYYCTVNIPPQLMTLFKNKNG